MPVYLKFSGRDPQDLVSEIRVLQLVFISQLGKHLSSVPFKVPFLPRPIAFKPFQTMHNETPSGKCEGDDELVPRTRA